MTTATAVAILEVALAVSARAKRRVHVSKILLGGNIHLPAGSTCFFGCSKSVQAQKSTPYPLLNWVPALSKPVLDVPPTPAPR